MAGREFETVAIDVAIGGAADEEPELLTWSSLLAFAEIEPVRVPALSLDRHVAEKLHAYTRMYASDSQSSRVKDLIDLVLVSTFAEFRGSRLRTAIVRTFDARGTHLIPAAFSQPPPNWERTYARLAAGVGIDNSLQAAHRAVARFLDPVLARSIRADARWDPNNSAWN